MKKVVRIFLWLLIICTITLPYTMSRYVSSLHKTINLNVREPKFTVVYYPNDSGVTGTMSSKEVSYNSDATLDAVTYDGGSLIFDSWNTQPDGTGTSYADGAAIGNYSSVESDTLPLYAQWISTEMYEITYSGFDSTSGFTTTVAQNAPLFVNFGSTNYAISSVTMGGTELNPNAYSFINNTLSISSVTGNVTITAVKIVNVDVTFDENNNELQRTFSITQLSAIIDQCGATAISSSKTINRIVVNIPYTSNANKTYSVDIQVNVNGSTVAHQNVSISKGSGALNPSFDVNIPGGQLFSIDFVKGTWPGGNEKCSITSGTITVYFAED